MGRGRSSPVDRQTLHLKYQDFSSQKTNFWKIYIVYFKMTFATIAIGDFKVKKMPFKIAAGDNLNY